MLNSNPGLMTPIPSTNHREFNTTSTSLYTANTHIINREISGSENAFNSSRSDQSGRFHQGSDGGSLPDSPVSSGHDGILYISYTMIFIIDGKCIKYDFSIIVIVSILEPEIGESNFITSHAKHQRVTGTDISLSNTVNVTDNQQGNQSCKDRFI